MKILNIVSSNVVTDPRVTKQLYTINSITEDYLAIGKVNHLITKKSIEEYPYKYELFGVTQENEKLYKKIIRRALFGFQVINKIHKYKPDVIHANDFDVLFIVAMSGYDLDKVVFDAHEIYAKNTVINSNFLLSKLVETLEKKIIKKVKAFITVSNAAKEYYIMRNYPQVPIVITNAPIKENIEYNKKNKVFEVIYQGQIVDYRGYEEFLRAGKYIDDINVQLKIRGFGPLKDKLQQIKYDENIKNVLIEPPVEMSEMVSSLTSSHIGVVLTKGISINYEYTVSNKLFECLHAGLPVIMSPVKEHILLNEKYNFGIVIDKVTPENIAEAIRKVSSDQKLFEELRNNALKTAEIFTWQKESEKLIDIYKGC